MIPKTVETTPANKNIQLIAISLRKPLGYKKFAENHTILEEYSYDHNRDRIKKIEYHGSTNDTFYYISDDFVRKINSSGSYDTVYFYDGNTLLAKNESGTMYFFHNDHLGSTDLMTNSAGAIVEETHYYPFGMLLEGGAAENRLFTSKELDSTNLYYFGARYYDPFAHLFTQPDPLIANIYDPQSLNAYSYVRNNPYRYTDENGEFATLVTAAAGVVAGWTIGGGYSVIDQIWNEDASLFDGTIDWRRVGRDTVYGGAVGGIIGATYGLAGIPSAVNVASKSLPYVYGGAQATEFTVDLVKIIETPNSKTVTDAFGPEATEKVVTKLGSQGAAKGVQVFDLSLGTYSAIKDLTPTPILSARDKDRLISDLNSQIRKLNKEKDRLSDLRSNYMDRYGSNYKKYWKKSDAYERLEEIDDIKDDLAKEKKRIRNL